MSISRSESQNHYNGRRRSNTAQSIFKNPPVSQPLKYGDTKVLTAWVHDPKDSPNITLNQSWWPGVAEGDLLRLTPQTDPSTGFLFKVTKDEGNNKHQLQISIPRHIADRFGLKNSGEVSLTKVDPSEWSADYVELVFQDQYLGRNEMWRLERHLVGQCIYVDQEISFIGVIAAKVHAIYISEKKVSTAYITSRTKVVFRSLSAKVTMFIQVCRELWGFAGDGERYYEKIVHSFLPELFSRWREAGTTHIVTIVLISRVYYDESEIQYAAGPLRQDDDGKWYKDFFKVITDLEVVYDWKKTLVSLKDSFWAFQRDILLAHHHHRAALMSPSANPDQARLIGRISYAHQGPILEALNLGFNPTETHYIDRSFSLTGSSTIIITPGTGYFRVNKQLLRLTTTRMLDQGFAIDLVSLGKPPLHQSPVFCFRGYEPEIRPDLIGIGKVGARSLDPLWGGDEGLPLEKEKSLFWWEPFWMSVSFWDKQMDLPFRQDRFVARGRMHEIEMLGLLDHDVLSSTALPFLPDLRDPNSTPNAEGITAADADRYDTDVFTLKQETKPLALLSRNSLSSSTGTSGSLPPVWYRGDVAKRPLSNRLSDNPKIPPIQESPYRQSLELPPEDSVSQYKQRLSAASTMPGLSKSPSQSSMRSVRTETSAKTATEPKAESSQPTRPAPIPRPSAKSIFSPAWLFSQFRSGLSQPQASPVSATAVKSPPPPAVTSHALASRAPPQMSNIAHTPAPLLPKPMNIKNPSVGRSSTRLDDDLLSHRSSYTRHSPIGTPPREEATFGKRRSGTLSSGIAPMSSSSPIVRMNPLNPATGVPYPMSSLAQRWQHIFAQPLYKHDIKWKSMITPGCLPLTVEYFPPSSELESSYDVFSYEFVVDPPEMKSFLVRPPSVTGYSETVRRAWALEVMRGMVALRLAQGFQFVIRPTNTDANRDNAVTLRRSLSYGAVIEDINPKPAGAAEVLKSVDDPVFLSMSNEIHRISYVGDSIQMRRYVRRMPRSEPFEYKCLIWPKLGVGYTELSTSFVSHGLENYGWNRLDMLVAGYENQFNESLRYWRTRFLVIPADDVPQSSIGPAGEKLNDEEIRLLGMDKLAELFSKLRWVSPDDKGKPIPPVRFLPTDLYPVSSVLDDGIVAQLDEIHAAGPLRKKMKSERDIGDMTLADIAKAMREEEGVPIKDHRWHGITYSNSFVGAEMVSWMVREFRDISSREQAVEMGEKLREQGLFEHCRKAHGFLDGYYFYVLRGEYIVPMTPRGGWFRSGRHASGNENNARAAPGSLTQGRASTSNRKSKKRLILSQSMVIDIDPNKRSDQAECVLLHHDIIHNPATCFHFELQWIGTTARCIDDILRQWSRAIERYGLKLVEGYVSQISDIRDRNPFQSCFPLPLAVSPPVIPDLEQRVPEGTQTAHYFETAILRKFQFVLDIEAGHLYPDQVDVVYSYRRAPFTYSQWVHRSGVAFVQVLGGSEGFLFLTNRLMAPGRLGTAHKQQRPAAAAEDLRIKLNEFCSDKDALQRFYDEEISRLGQPHLEEPPSLDL